MKISKILVAGAVSAGVLVQAKAQTTDIYITGSTAFRSAVYAAIHDTGGHGVFGANSFVETTYGASSASGATEMMWVGNMPSGNTTVPVRIKAFWSGSVAGVQAVTSGNNIASFIADSPTDSGGNFASVTPAANPGDFEPAPGHPALISMSDSFQRSTLYTTPVLHDQQVGIVPFEWIKNNGSLSDPHWANLTNVTDEVLRTFLFGSIPLAQFTGVASDWNGVNPVVYAVGRDDGSGTRLAAFADTGFGIFATPTQFDITASPTTILEDPATVDPFGNPVAAGSQGYSSGGKVSTAMQISGSATAADPFQGGTGWYAVAYVGLSDAATAIMGGAAALTYNGVGYSPAAVQNGQYTFWGYEHLVRTAGLSGNSLTFYNNLYTVLTTGTYETASGAGFELNTMNCTRAGDGSDPTHN